MVATNAGYATDTRAQTGERLCTTTGRARVVNCCTPAAQYALVHFAVCDCVIPPNAEYTFPKMGQPRSSLQIDGDDRQYDRSGRRSHRLRRRRSGRNAEAASPGWSVLLLPEGLRDSTRIVRPSESYAVGARLGVPGATRHLSAATLAVSDGYRSPRRGSRKLTLSHGHSRLLRVVLKVRENIVHD